MDEPTTPKRPRRPHGSGALYETAAGLWRGRYVTVDPLTHKRVRRYVSGHTRQEAGRRLRDAMADAARKSAAGSSPTVEWWCRRWLDTSAQRIRPATLRSYRQAIRLHVLPYLGSWPLAELRAGDVERWISDLSARGLAPSTIATSRRIFAACLADAERDGRIARNVARLAHAPRVEGTTRRRALTAAEARVLLEAARTDPDAGLLVTLALATGARVGELLGLDWSDIDVDAGTLRIRGSRSRAGLGPTKSARGRRLVTLPPFALEALRAETRATGPVFTMPDGGPMIPERAGERWRALRKRAGFDGLRFHDLRGTVATLGLAAGIPPKALADVLGHDPAVLLRTYAGPIEGGRDAVAAALAGALGGER